MPCKCHSWFGLWLRWFSIAAVLLFLCRTSFRLDTSLCELTFHWLSFLTWCARIYSSTVSHQQPIFTPNRHISKVKLFKLTTRKIDLFRVDVIPSFSRDETCNSNALDWQFKSLYVRYTTTCITDLSALFSFMSRRIIQSFSFSLPLFTPDR